MYLTALKELHVFHSGTEFSTERFHHDALNTGNNCWFSHDVTKTQTTKLSSQLIFYFHGISEQLKSKDLQEVTGRTSSPA